MSRFLLPLALLLAVAGCQSDAAPEPPAPAAEVIVLAHNRYLDVPLAEAVAALEGATVRRDADSTERVALGGSTPIEFVVYPDHARIVERLQDRAHPPAAAVFMITAADGSFPQHDEQALLAHEAGVPIPAALMTALHLVDDEELLDLQEQFDIGETLTEAGYPGVPVVRVSAVEALQGDAADQAALRSMLDAVRQAVR